MGRKEKWEACDLYCNHDIHPSCPWLVPVVGVEGRVDGARAFDVIGPENLATTICQEREKRGP